MYRKIVSYPIITAFFLVLIGIDVSTSSQGSSKTTEPLEAQLVVHQVVADKRGRERLLPASKAKPGDVLEYQVTYKNGSRAKISDVMATLPIPVGTQYVEASAYPKQVEASIDEKEFFPVPLIRDERTKRLITPAAPKTAGMITEPVPLVEYRVLRWKLPTISPKGSAVTRARASLINTPTTIQ
jgi:uncharacterized repeat protein (TIGR01451 family)